MSAFVPPSDRNSGADFDRDVAVVAQGDGTFASGCPAGWDASGRMQGGMLAAQLLLALSETVDDVGLHPRAITTHFLRAPVVGDYSIACTVERVGRAVTNVSARVTQSDKLLALAMAVFATDREGLDFDELPMPQVAPPTPSRRVEAYMPEISRPFSQRIVVQQRLGDAPLSSSVGPMENGAWFGFSDPRPIDASGLLVFCDAALMPWWSRLSEMIPTATLDYTVHFRADLPRLDPDEMVFCQSETRLVRGGLLDWDVVAWAPDGTVMCLARQQLVSFK